MYLPLPSIASLDYFADNTLTTYTTKLPKRIIELNGNWEAAIELIFPKSWYNIGDNEMWIEISRGDEKNILQIEEGYIIQT